MSPINGYLTPEARATMEAVLAKLAAPGACNPEDDAPVIDATPDEEAVRRDGRSQAQRNHDGLLAWLRALLASGELGQHNGLPVSIVVTTTLKDLEAAAGKAHTGGGSLVPMSDVIRMASHANHYLATFDNGRPLALYHTKRFASPHSESCCTPRTGGVRSRAVTHRPTTAKSTTSEAADHPAHPYQRPRTGLRAR